MERDHFKTRSGVKNLRIDGCRPSDAVVFRVTNVCALRRRTIIAEVGYESSIFLANHRGLNATIAHNWLACGPVITSVIADGHDAKRITVRIHRNQDAPGR